MKLTIRLLLEDDGRWLGLVDELSGAMAYGSTQDEASAKIQALAYWRIAEMLDAGELGSVDRVAFERVA